jgi:hypothetical protein
MEAEKMENKRMYKANAADAITAVIVLALCLFPIFLFAGRQGKTVYVYLEGKQAEKTGLNETKIIKINSVEIEVKDGRVRVAKSDCPHQICSHTGWISSPAQTIVCVPNKVLVEIKNDGNSQEFDAVSY